MFHNPDRIVVEAGDDTEEVRLWSQIHWAQLYRPHMVIQPRAVDRRGEIYYILDATEAYLTLLDISSFSIDFSYNNVREYVATTGLLEYFIFDYCLGVFFQEEDAPAVVIDVTTEPYTLPRYIAGTYAHLLTNEQLRMLLLELQPGGSIPRTATHLTLVTKLLDHQEVVGEERENMIALTQAMQKKKKKAKDCRGRAPSHQCVNSILPAAARSAPAHPCWPNPLAPLCPAPVLKSPMPV